MDPVMNIEAVGQVRLSEEVETSTVDYNTSSKTTAAEIKFPLSISEKFQHHQPHRTPRLSPKNVSKMFQPIRNVNTFPLPLPNIPHN